MECFNLEEFAWLHLKFEYFIGVGLSVLRSLTLPRAPRELLPVLGAGERYSPEPALTALYRAG